MAFYGTAKAACRGLTGYSVRASFTGLTGITTGLLVVCKNDAAHQAIAAQLKEHTITRRYRAIVHGVIREEDGTVNAPIGRHPTDRKKMAITGPTARRR